MEFTRYSHKDIESAKDMMKHHVDYTPQYNSDDNRDATMSYFEETFTEEPYQNLTYILKTDFGEMLGLMSIDKYGDARKDWLIACMFMLEGMQTDAHAHYMVEQLYTMFHEPHYIYVHLYPTANKAMKFWSELGFKTDLDKPITENAQDEILTTYWKKINDVDSASSSSTDGRSNVK